MQTISEDVVKEMAQVWSLICNYVPMSEWLHVKDNLQALLEKAGIKGDILACAYDEYLQTNQRRRNNMLNANELLAMLREREKMISDIERKVRNNEKLEKQLEGHLAEIAMLKQYVKKLSGGEK